MNMYYWHNKHSTQLHWIISSSSSNSQYFRKVGIRMSNHSGF